MVTLGGWGVHVPYHRTWVHEAEVPPIPGRVRMREVAAIDRLVHPVAGVKRTADGTLDAAGHHHGPFGGAPARQFAAREPPAHGCPDHGDQRGREPGEARVAARVLGGDVPARVDQAREQDEQERIERHGTVPGGPGPIRRDR